MPSVCRVRGVSGRISLLLTLSIPLLSPTVLAAVERRAEAGAIGVSPGQTDRAGTVSGRCPTFSWGAVTGAERYELVAYELTEERAGDRQQPALAHRLPGSALSWTPDVDSCLAAGKTYIWFVRAEGPDLSTDWSSGRFFRTPAAPSRTEIVRALRSYLQSGGTLKELVGVTLPELAAPEAVEADDGQLPVAAVEPAAYAADIQAGTSHPVAEKIDSSGAATTPVAALDNWGGGIFSATSGSSSAAVHGVNLYRARETVKGYLGVQGSLDFDGMDFLDDAIEGAEIGVLGVSAGDVASDNFGVVGVGDGEGSAGGRFFHGSGGVSVANEVLLGTSTDGLRCWDCIDGRDLVGTKLVTVECLGLCTSTLNDICGWGYRAFAVACADIHESEAGTYECSGGGLNNICREINVADGVPLSHYCDDVEGWDAQVHCLRDGTAIP